MAIRPEDEYTNITAASANYPGGSFKSETSPGALDGSPLDILWGNDLLGILQKLLDVAGITASGTPDTVLASDYFDAMNEIFSRFATHVDSGAANAFVLSSASDANIAAYKDGREVLFLATNGNPGGASTIDTAGLGVVSLKLPGGGALPVDAVASGQYVRAVYRSAGPRYEILNIASGITFDDSGVGYTAKDVQAALVAVVARANHTGTQALGTITGHTKAAHDALLINAAELGGSAAALYALLVSPAFTGNPTVPTQTPLDSSTKISSTKYTDDAVAAATGAGAIAQADLKTATGTVGSGIGEFTLPGGEYGFYPQITIPGATTAISQISAALLGPFGYTTNIYLGTAGMDARQRYIQASPPYKIGDIGWGHFVYQLRNKSTGDVLQSYEAQDPPWAYNGPNWLDKNDPELLALIPHPFPEFGTDRFPESYFEVVLVDLRDFDVNLWLYDNMGRGKTILTDLKDFATVGKIKTHSQVGLPEIPGFTDKIKIRSRN